MNACLFRNAYLNDVYYVQTKYPSTYMPRGLQSCLPESPPHRLKEQNLQVTRTSHASQKSMHTSMICQEMSTETFSEPLG
jgi:hypothetical protein